jgi:hypothetical protein
VNSESELSPPLVTRQRQGDHEPHETRQREGSSRRLPDALRQPVVPASEQGDHSSSLSPCRQPANSLQLVLVGSACVKRVRTHPPGQQRRGSRRRRRQSTSRSDHGSKLGRWTPHGGLSRRQVGTGQRLRSRFRQETRLICVPRQRGRGVTLSSPWVWISMTASRLGRTRRHTTVESVTSPANPPGSEQMPGHQGRRTSVGRQSTTIQSWLTRSERGSSPVARAERGTKEKVSGPSCATGSRVSSGSIAGCERRTGG